MPSCTRTPEQFQSENITRLASRAETVAALLSTLHILPAAQQHAIFSTSVELANDLVADMAALANVAPEPKILQPAAAMETLQDSLNTAFSASDDILCAASVVSDLLRLAFYECGRVDNTRRIEAAMLAVERYVADVHDLNKTIQSALGQLEKKIGGTA